MQKANGNFYHDVWGLVSAGLTVENRLMIVISGVVPSMAQGLGLGVVSLATAPAGSGK